NLAVGTENRSAGLTAGPDRPWLIDRRVRPHWQSAISRSAGEGRRSDQGTAQTPDGELPERGASQPRIGARTVPLAEKGPPRRRQAGTKPDRERGSQDPGRLEPVDLATGGRRGTETADGPPWQTDRIPHYLRPDRNEDARWRCRRHGQGFPDGAGAQGLLQPADPRPWR